MTLNHCRQMTYAPQPKNLQNIMSQFPILLQSNYRDTNFSFANTISKRKVKKEVMFMIVVQQIDVA
jgi:hypothetical protein